MSGSRSNRKLVGIVALVVGLVVVTPSGLAAAAEPQQVAARSPWSPAQGPGPSPEPDPGSGSGSA
ncbi:MAG TPA: hypothetical protein VK735_03240, partial [Pseudonocardia sp.]|uniref:hypothetical protein n=1 Tax=Pseudonocardia sp. TaxID=60912 RepID=UPI002BA187D5